MMFFCECCGYALKEDPYPEGIPAYSVCDCCGMQSGRDDNTKASMLRYRDQWIANGAQWFNPQEKPNDWNLQLQLQHARK